MNTRTLIFKLVIFFLAIEALLVGWYFHAKFLPAITVLKPANRYGIATFIFSAIYYLGSLIAFFMQPSLTNHSENDVKAITVAGKQFRPNLKLTNPSNHLIISTLMIMATLLFLIYSFGN